MFKLKRKTKGQKEEVGRPQLVIEDIPDLPWKGLAEIADEACKCVDNADCDEICSLVFDRNGMVQIIVGSTIYYRPSFRREYIECRNHYREEQKKNGKRVNSVAY